LTNSLPRRCMSVSNFIVFRGNEMKIKLMIGAFAAALMLSACGSGEDMPQDTTTPPPAETMPAPEATPPDEEMMPGTEMPSEEPGTLPETPAEEPPTQ